MFGHIEGLEAHLLGMARDGRHLMTIHAVVAGVPRDAEPHKESKFVSVGPIPTAAPFRGTPMIELGSDASGTWLWVPDRTVVETKSGSFTAVPGLRLFPVGTMWSAYFVKEMPQQGRSDYVYVDITTVATRRDDLIEFVDLDLDVEVFEGAAVRVLDRDEFEENAEAWCYPDDLVAAAVQTCTEVETAMTRRDRPFDG